MTVVTRQRLPIGASASAVATPYAERAERQESRMDSALLAAWGRYLRAFCRCFEQRRLERFVESVEDLKTR